MVSSVFKQAAEMLRRRRKNKWWLAAFLCLAVVAVVGTLALLKPTGRAMTREEKVLVCKHVIHQHTEGCYAEGENGKELVCGCADFVIHRHAETCYDAAGNLACPLPEVEAHVHEAGCFEEERTLICGQLEGDGGHGHTEGCYGEPERILVCGQEESEAHAHSEECYQTGEAPLICGMEAGAGGHVHTEECFQVDQKLICTRPEARPHIHDETCYVKDAGGNETRTCGLLQVEEHIHREDCFETIEVAAEDTEISGEAATEPESAEDTEETESQTETEGVSETGTAESEEGETAPIVYVCGLEEHTHGEECHDENGELVCELAEHTHDESCMEAAEENADMITQTWENENYIITAAYTEAAGLPENALLQVEEITEKSDPERYSQRDAEAQELLEENMRMKCLFNIGFFVDGVEVEPQDKVTVTVQFLDGNGYAEGDPITVVHFAKEETEVLEGSQIDSNGVTSFDTDSFSDMAVYTTDDGQVKNFSDLKRRLENASDGDEIVLGADFEVTEEDLKDPDPDKTDAGGITVKANIHVTLDLNGHTITVTGNKSLINVKDATSLTIKDSGWRPEQDSRNAGAAWGEYGWKGSGSYDSATGTLTYYEIDTEAAGTGTNEKLYTHTVTAGGKIIWSGSEIGTEPLIFVSCGTLTLESGMLNGGGGRRAILLAASEANQLNLAGGYICGGVSKKDHHYNYDTWTDKTYQVSGGAICAGKGTTINLTGTVIANNRVEYGGTTENWGSGGGIAMLGSGTLNISGGMVTGNQSSVYGKGGGIYTADGVTVNLTGGNICNNMDQMQNANEIGGGAGWGQPRHREYSQFDGGGGILIGLGGTLNMTGGKICGNTGSGGGGIQTAQSLRSQNQVGPKLHINGGYITRNHAVYHEGGGLVIVGENGTAEIAAAEGAAVYITNNKTETKHDWGGGGAFCVESAQMVIQGALISGNTAKGYGGGVGGCSNAQVINSVSPLTLDLGTAVYDNHAVGDPSATATAEGKWYKDGLTQDSEFAVGDTVFQRRITKSESGEETSAYDDYYCEQYSTVSNLMLGGGYSNWIGSANNTEDITGKKNDSVEIQFKREQNDIRSAQNRMGLTADPTQKSKDKAYEGASVFITGNYSTTHGGGVQCNGILLLGDCKNYTFGDSLQFEATKQLFDADGSKITDLTGTAFKFGVYPYNKKTETKGECTETAQNDAAGMIRFAPIAVSGDGEQDSVEKSFLIQEISDSVQGGIQWESTEYLVSFTLKKETSVAAGNASYQWNHYRIDPDTVVIQSRSGDAGEWTSAQRLTSEAGSSANDAKIYRLPTDLGETSGATFTNRKTEKIDVRVKKEWSGTQAELAKEELGAKVQVQLFRSADGGTEEAYGAPVDLTKENEWSHTWEGLVSKSSDAAGSHTYRYTVKEIGMTFEEGSSFAYDQFYSAVGEPTAEGDVQTRVITNTHRDDLTYNLKLTKVMGDAVGEAVLPYSPLAGAKFELYRIDEENKVLLEFTQAADGYEYVGEAAAGQDSVGNPEVRSLITDKYGLILVKGLPKGTYQFREIQAPAGFVAQPDDKMPVVTLDVTESGEYVKEIAYSETPIVDPLYYYEIPESGGMGTGRYMTLGGVLFLAALGIGGFCLGKKRSRKEKV